MRSHRPLSLSGSILGLRIEAAGPTLLPDAPNKLEVIVRYRHPRSGVMPRLAFDELAVGIAPKLDGRSEIIEDEIPATCQNGQDGVSVAVGLPEHRKQQRPDRPAKLDQVTPL